MFKEVLLGLLVLVTILGCIHFFPVLSFIIVATAAILVAAYGVGYLILDELRERRDGY